ncbi:MAG TPA: response regulator [Phototrophicaceae bacterium]|nr:response regulator [Phototrophicaceae bacterium]
MKNRRFLIVEDEPDGQDVVKRLLACFKVAADAAGNAEEALTLLALHQYDAAIIDLGLPGMDGMELLQAIRQNPTTANLPCVAITAYHTSVVKQSALHAGFDAYFAKPIEDTSFIRELDRIVAGN